MYYKINNHLLNFSLKIRVSEIFCNLYYAIIIGLVLFGTAFSKFHVIGPLYLHDLILIVVVLFALLIPPLKFSFPPLFILGCLSVVYLIISFFLDREVPVSIIIRQYAIFGYMILFGFLFSKFYSIIPVSKHIRFFGFLSFGTLGIQSIYVIFKMTEGTNVLEKYNYFSPAIVLGMIIAAAYFLSYSQGLARIGGFILALLLSFTTGHSSAFLAVVTVWGTYLFVYSTTTSKVISIIILMVLTLGFVLILPQFQDNNAGFRLISWGATMKRLVLSNWVFFGEGFGVPYFNETLIQELHTKLGGVVDLENPQKPYEAYFSSVHNSFLTIFLHVGLLPGLIVFYPVKMFFLFSIQSERYVNARQHLFLMSSLIGLSIWVAFNEILEVPHSVAIFWFVYFVCVQSFTMENNKKVV